MKPTIRRFSFFLLASLAALSLAAPLAASTVAIVTDTTPGYYNSSIGNLLNGTSSAFPDGTDPSLDFPSPPNLTPAQSVLGDWLQNPPTLNSPNWSSTPVTVPLQWAVGTETAIVYRVEVPASGYTGVTMRFGVDNGIFVWLDGVYRGGFIRPGGAIPGEHTFTVGNLSAGTHYIQILREDHSITNEYTVEITGQAPGPEILLTGNGANILDGDNSPSPADHTNFGTAPAGSGTVVRTFTIRNTGELDLHLTGMPMVAVSGTNAADFTVTQLPASTVAVGPGTTFQVTFTPPALGNRNATLTIASDDGDENPYDFAITGTGSGALNAIYNTGADVPLSTDGFTATGSTVNFTLNYPPNDAPVTGTELMVVKNTGPGLITGVFDNLAQGQTVTLSHAGSIYQFVANYYGGTGNDLVLVWKKNRLFAWGYNAHGQLGINSLSQRTIPTPVYSIGVLAGKTIVNVAVGGEHCVALCSDGTVATWGWNNFGQLGDGSTSQRVVPVAVNRATGASALFGKTVVAVAAGQYHSLALCSDGTVAAWGNNQYGQLGNGSATSTVPFPVAVNRTTVLSTKTVAGLGAGDRYTVALCSDGTVASWGDNGSGQLGDNSTTQRLLPVAVNATSRVSALFGRRVIRVAGGGSHVVALCSDGTLAAWGDGGGGQLGENNIYSRYLPIVVNTTTALSGKTVLNIAAGHYHSLARCADGTLAAWGLNNLGQLGDNSTINRPLPVAVIQTTPALSGKIVSVLIGGSLQSMALCLDGTLAAWGDNQLGMLGDGTTTDRYTPVEVNRTPLAPGERFAGLYQGSTNVHTLAMVAAPVAPEIHVTGNGANIFDGDNEPGPEDHTYFGLGGTVVRTFTILNVGNGALNLTATPKVAVSGPNAADFTVTLPPASPIASGGSTTFQVTFSPSAPGDRSATLSIANDDANGNPYDFAISGTGYSIIQQWRQLYFGTHENTGTAANTADFDFDGVKNLLEFAFGTDPTSASGLPALSYAGNVIVPGSITTEFIGGTPRAEFIRRLDYLAAGLTYTVEFSADLITWEASAAIPGEIAINGILQVVGEPYPLLTGGAQAHFFKVTVGITP